MKRKTLAISLLVISGAALACSTIERLNVSTHVIVEFMDLEYQRWEKISAQLQSWYGDQYRDVAISTVNIPIRHCVTSSMCQNFERNMFKPCNTTLAQAAHIEAVKSSPCASVTSTCGEGGGAGVDDPFPGGGYGDEDPFANCTSNSVKTCVSAGGGQQQCEYQTFLECPMG